MKVSFRNPFEFISDDARAVEIALALEALPQVSEEGALAANCWIRAVKGHETHWVLVICFHGFDKDEDNGYGVAAWAKNSFGVEVLDKEIAKYQERSGAELLADSKLERPEKGSN